MLHLAAEESVTVKFTLWCRFNSVKFTSKTSGQEKYLGGVNSSDKLNQKKKNIYTPHSHSAITQVIEKSACKTITK